MSYYLRMPVDGAEPVVIEVTAEEDGMVRAARPGTVIDRIDESVQAAVERLRPAVTAVAETFARLPMGPKEVSVEFAVKFTAEAGAVIASTAAEGSFQVTVTWERPTPAG
ncbi:hypothetical protein ITP53_28705 [Nonomuraea sp. K274]|uniref:Trypsin-co-occurring domain-containing protein n=1 Tax=Nonomuraea cypriaca TaxID=1187855 RepID=A0A931AG59_9ACTN|nr:CU044_2847 family protein [Nonomuraea cypriaca]MBF8189644.1 hypothetical protein [Nonomuraea cypriaca]